MKIKNHLGILYTGYIVGGIYSFVLDFNGCNILSILIGCILLGIGSAMVKE